MSFHPVPNIPAELIKGQCGSTPVLMMPVREKIVRDNDALTEWYGNPEVDRAAYLDGYNHGAHRLCQSSVIEQWGAQGKPFPASCDSAVNIAELRLKWQQGLNKTFPR